MGAAIFDRIAAKYDSVNCLISFGLDSRWKNTLTKEVGKHNPKQVLDLACGTGTLTRRLAKFPNVSVTGADPSSGMLAKAMQTPTTNIIYREAFAENLPFDDEAFDTVTICYGIRNFEDRVASFKHIFRTLTPQGHLFILEFSLPERSFWNAPQRFYIHRLLPLLGKWGTKDASAYEYLKSSVESFPQPQTIETELKSCGFEEITYKRLIPSVVVLYSAQKI